MQSVTSPPSLLHRICVSHSLWEGVGDVKVSCLYSHSSFFSHRLIQCPEDERSKRKSQKHLLTKMGKRTVFSLVRSDCHPVRPALGSGCPPWDPACLCRGPQTELCLRFFHVSALCTLVIPSRWSSTPTFATQTNLAQADICKPQHHSYFRNWSRPILTSVLLTVPHHTVSLQFSFL